MLPVGYYNWRRSMSRKQKLETLAALGVLKDSDVKHIQGRLSQRPKAYGRALTGWVAIALIEAIVIAGLTVLAWVNHLR
jgi:hypothetical protein